MKIFKRLVIGFSVLGFLLVVAAIVIPFVVDVDKYRPQIVSAVNDRINGKLELGKLKLSLWGQIRVEVGGLSLQDAQGTRLVGVSDAYFHLPFSSIFSGSPELVFKMLKPEVNVVKDKAGHLNVMSLLKSAPAEPQTQTSPGQPPAASAAPIELPPIVSKARLGVELRDAAIRYQDVATGLDTRIKDFNLIIRDISLTRPTTIEVWAVLDTKMGDLLVVKGPFRVTGEVRPELAGSKLANLALGAKIDLDSLNVTVPSLFEKKAGVPAGADFAVTVSGSEAKIERFNAHFFNAEIRSSGLVRNVGLESAGSGASAQPPVVNYSVESNSIELKPWVELIPMLKEYEIGGTAHFDAKIDGPSDKLGYRAKFDINALTAKAPKLKVQPRFDLTANIVTDQLEGLVMTMKAPGNELTVKGKVVSFTSPKADFEVTSSGMDLDQLVEFPPPKAKGAMADAKTGAASGGAVIPVVDYDALIAPMRESKIAAATSADVRISIKMLKAYEVRMTDLSGKISLQNLLAEFDSFSMMLFGGTVKAGFSTELKPKVPTYKFSGSVADLDLNEAVVSQFQFLKNTVIGKATFDINGQGKSYNPDSAIANLKAKGSMKVTNATFATIDVGKMASEALNKGMERVAQKIPQLVGKSVGVPSGREQRFESISSDFVITDGKFHAPNFIAKSAPNTGIDINGDTLVGMIDYSLKTKWELVDTHNLTRARDISVEQSGVKVEHILADGAGPVRFPVHAGCTLMVPCYSYTEVPEYLVKVALNNIKSAVEGKARSEVAKKTEELKRKAEDAAKEAAKKILPVAPAAVKNAVEGLKKKLFR